VWISKSGGRGISAVCQGLGFPVRDSPLRFARRREKEGRRKRGCPPRRRLRRHHHQGLQLPGQTAAQLHAEALPQDNDCRWVGAGKEGEIRILRRSPSTSPSRPLGGLPRYGTPSGRSPRPSAHTSRRSPGSSISPFPYGAWRRCRAAAGRWQDSGGQ